MVKEQDCGDCGQRKTTRRWRITASYASLTCGPGPGFPLRRSKSVTIRAGAGDLGDLSLADVWGCRLRLQRKKTTLPVAAILSSLLTFVVLFSRPGFSQAPAATVEGFLAQAGEREKSGDYAGAEKVYRQALAEFPDQPEVLKHLGIIYQTELNFPESIEVFQKALLSSPQYPEVNFYLGLSFLGLNQYDKALEYFNAELKFHPEYRRAHYYAGQALLAEGRKGEAIQHFDTLVKENPNDTKVWYELARLYRSMAVQAYNRLAIIDPDSALLHALRAEGDAEDLRFPEAITEYEEVLKKQPDFPGVHFALGEIYFKLFKPTEAEPELKLALQEDPNNPPANYMLGQILLRNKKAAEALPLLQVAAAGDPAFMKAHLELGKCYLEMGRLQEAVQALARAAELAPHSWEPHGLLAEAYTRLNDEEKRRAELAIIEKLRRERDEKVQGAMESAAPNDR